MITQSLTIAAGGGKMPSYLARPDGAAPRPAVIVLQEIFGVNTEVKRITDLVASAGYVGLAINYYHRTHSDLNEPYTPEGLQNGFAAAGKVTRAGLTADIDAARSWLAGQGFVQRDRVATWGSCYGGNIAAPLASGEPEMLADAARIQAPLLLMFGGEDAYIPAEAVERIRRTLTEHHKTFEIHVYPDQAHAFFRESTAAMDGDAKGGAVKDAWTRVQAFLKSQLD